MKYACDIELFEPIVKEGSKWNTKGRSVIFSVEKKDKEAEEWWPRLTKDKVKNPLITIDWPKWKDVDEEEEEGAPQQDPMAGMDMGGMNAFGGGGAGGMPGMGMPGMPGMGGGAGGFDPAMLQQMMGGQMGMGGGADSDDEEGEESQVDPHAPETKDSGNLDDLDGDETADLKK